MKKLYPNNKRLRIVDYDNLPLKIANLNRYSVDRVVSTLIRPNIVETLPTHEHAWAIGRTVKQLGEQGKGIKAHHLLDCVINNRPFYSSTDPDASKFGRSVWWVNRIRHITQYNYKQIKQQIKN